MYTRNATTSAIVRGAVDDRGFALRAPAVPLLVRSFKLWYSASMMNFDRLVAVGYRRVSTDSQGRSGLGLEAQEAAIRAFCESRGLKLDSTFVEVESGKRSDRPELAKAFDRARRLRGVVVIAKLDRLARDVHFVSGLIKQGTAFACVDAPDDDAMMLHVRAAFAEAEALKISERTKAALKAAKARGVRLGNPQNLTDEGRVRGSETMRERAAADRAKILPEVKALREQGLSVRAISVAIGVSPMTVSRILALDEKVIRSPDRAMTPGRSRADLEAYAAAREERERALD